VSDAARLLAAVIAAPDDDDARLAYAASLGETPRARFIVAQVRLGQRLDPARREQYLREEAELLPGLRAELSARVADIADGYPRWTFRRGFIDALTTDATEKFLDGARALFDEEPIAQLSLRRVGAAQLGRVLDEHLLRGVRALSLAGPIGDDGAIALAASPDGARLRSLNLSACAITDAAARALAASAPLAGVEDLSLNSNRLTSASARALADRASPLRVLHLAANDIDDDGVRALTEGVSCADLRELGLRDNPITDDGGRLLLAPNLWPRMWRLEVPGTEISSEMREALRGRWGARVTVDPDWDKPRRPREEELELRSDDAIAFSGTRRLLLDWAAAVLDAHASADLYGMDGFARPASSPCARCRTQFDEPAVASDGLHVEDCPTCKGGGVTLGPPRPWSDLDSGAVTTLISRLDARARLGPEEAAAAADSLTEVESRLAPRWAELTGWVIDGLRQSWSLGLDVSLRRRGQRARGR
jgi:uncharacterized protein (TIGR02996 family)